MAEMGMMGRAVVCVALLAPGAAWAQASGPAVGVQGPPQVGLPKPADHHRMATMRPLQPAAGAGEGSGQASGMRPEDALARLVQEAGVIFAGEVYAVRMPEGQQNAGTKGGQHSANPDAVEVEFRVDQGVRGVTIGNPYVMREPLAEWRSQGEVLTLHKRAVVLLTKPDAAGMSRPVEGLRGVLPIDGNNNVDLSGLHAAAGASAAVPGAAAGTPGAAVMNLGQAGGAGQGAAAAAGADQGAATGEGQADPKVPDVTTAGGEQTLVAGSENGRMPELQGATIPYLALMRDLYVLAAAETGGPKGNGTAEPGK